MKILCVEDGSVDTDKIETEGLKDGKILVYRRGATQPFVLDLGDDDIRQNVYDRIKDNAKQEYDYGELIYKIPAKELHEILDDENRKITLKEYQEILFQLKRDIIKKASEVPCGQISAFQWYNGEMNGFQLALDLSEHIKEEEL